ncbi:hypothetical protein [Mangrovibacterium lignilyticum]|uniref:hypothetical protein n=1 Tax=Mangrovibacterium lignilyticum TaxID=2668052 RepID=UPI0013D323DB|nr:hypothetical protein [Mangrovibacterium lignilyticum]
MDIDDLVETIKKKTNPMVALEIDRIISSGNTGSEILYQLGHFLENGIDEVSGKIIENEIGIFRSYCANNGIIYE